MTHTKQKKQLTRMQGFLIDDLKKLEYHTNELIENIYVSGQKENFKHDVEEIERFFSYWNNHIKNINK